MSDHLIPGFLHLFFLILMPCFFTSKTLSQSSHGILRRIMDPSKDEYAYVNAEGDTVIPFGKYPFCFTEKFDKLAIVATRDDGIIGIDRNENILFNVFVFDNGPDYLSNGLFRIVKDGKIGYADRNGKVVIEPQFDGAYPFKNGIAEVGKGCQILKEGEHSRWAGGEWYLINKKGNIIRKISRQ